MRASILPSLLLVLGLALAAAGCNGPTGPEKPGSTDSTAINEDVVKIRDARKGYRVRNYVMAAWPRRRNLYPTAPLSWLQVNDSLELTRDSVFVWEGPRLYVEANSEGTRLLYVLSEYVDASAGALYEMNTDTGETRLLRDSSYAISSAVYLPGSGGEKVVYYSYGPVPELNDGGPTPGYHLLNTETGEDSLLLKHRSPAGREEAMNGFDISPNGQTLLYPLQYTNVGRFKPPEVLTYELSTGTRDTLEIEFESQFIWLRYGPEGRRVLYGGYPYGVFNRTDNGQGDRVGIIDLSAMEKRELDTDTNPEGPSLDLFPRWSPTGQHVIYGSAPVIGDRGAVGPFSLYVLKTVN